VADLEANVIHFQSTEALHAALLPGPSETTIKFFR
jgi:hypothetical protein